MSWVGTLTIKLFKEVLTIAHKEVQSALVKSSPSTMHMPNVVQGK